MLEIKKLISASWIKFRIHKKELSWVFLGQIMAFSGGVVGVKLLTNMLGPQGYGELALGMTIAVVSQQIFYGPFGQSAFRYYSVYRDKNQLDLFWNALKKIGLYSGIFFILLSLLIGFLAKIIVSNKWFYLIIFASFFGILDGINGILIALQNAGRQRKIVALFQGLTQWLRPLSGFLAAILFSKNGQTVLAGFCIAMVFITIYQSRFLGNIKFKKGYKFGHVYNNSIYKNLFNYGYPFLIWGIFGAIQFSSDRWILKYFFSEREVGIYTAMYQIANTPILIIIGVISLFIMPILFEKSNIMDRKRIFHNVNKIVIFFLTISAGLLLLYLFFSRQIINILSGHDFTEYSNFLPLMLVGIILFQVGQLFYLFPMVTMQTSKYIMPKFFSMAILIFFGIVLVKYLGLIGIIYANLLTGLVYVLNVYYLNYRLVRA